MERNGQNFAIWHWRKMVRRRGNCWFQERFPSYLVCLSGINCVGWETRHHHCRYNWSWRKHKFTLVSVFRLGPSLLLLLLHFCLWTPQKEWLRKNAALLCGLKKNIQWALSSPQTHTSCSPPFTSAKLDFQGVGALVWSLCLWHMVGIPCQSRGDIQWSNCPGPSMCRAPQRSLMLQLKKKAVSQQPAAPRGFVFSGTGACSILLSRWCLLCSGIASFPISLMLGCHLGSESLTNKLIISSKSISVCPRTVSNLILWIIMEAETCISATSAKTLD